MLRGHPGGARPASASGALVLLAWDNLPASGQEKGAETRSRRRPGGPWPGQSPVHPQKKLTHHIFPGVADHLVDPVLSRGGDRAAGPGVHQVLDL